MEKLCPFLVTHLLGQTFKLVAIQSARSKRWIARVSSIDGMIICLKHLLAERMVTILKIVIGVARWILAEQQFNTSNLECSWGIYMISGVPKSHKWLNLNSNWVLNSPHVLSLHFFQQPNDILRSCIQESLFTLNM